MLEPIQGETGVNVVPGDVVAAAREACDASGAALIFDEIQTGMGRTGSLWAYEQLPARPDVLTSAKALGGGLPAGACVTAPELADTLQPGDHGSTFAGGPLASAAALAAFDVIDDPALLRRVRELGGRIREALEELPGVASTRGRGLMIGVILAEGRSAPAVSAELLASGLVVNAPRPETLRLLPPLTLGRRRGGHGAGAHGGRPRAPPTGSPPVRELESRPMTARGRWIVGLLLALVIGLGVALAIVAGDDSDEGGDRETVTLPTPTSGTAPATTEATETEPATETATPEGSRRPTEAAAWASRRRGAKGALQAICRPGRRLKP